MKDNSYKQAEDNLEKNEELFRTIFEQAPLGISLIDSLTGHIYEVNQKFADITGRTIAELSNIEWMSVTHPDDVQEELHNIELLNTGEINGFNMNKRYLHPDGSIIWINMKIALVVGNDTEHPRHLCMIEDITERKRLEEDIKDNEERFKTLKQTTMDGFSVVDINGGIIEVNDAYCRMSGYSKNELLSMNITDLECDDLTKQTREYIENIKVNGWGRFESIHRKVDGTVYKVQFNVIFLEVKRVFLCFINDITDRKQVEAEKENIANELKEKVQEIAFQNEEKAERAAELIIANRELAFEKEEKADRAAELIIANKELAFEKEEKADRAAELVNANKDLAFQNQEILYLGYHDQLTGLYNRRFYEEELVRLDTEKNLPLTIVMGDVNGLKLINDSFGHVVGDELLKKVSEVIRAGCGADDIIARLGGDEFVILLPKTDAYEAEQIIKHITELSLSVKVGSVDISISFGYETKNSEREDIQDIFKNAEDHMYEKKLFESPSIRGKTIKAIINTLHEKNKREEQHSHRVSELCKSMGEALGLHEHENEVLKSVGLLHDIGKIAIDENILNKPGELTKDEWKQIKRHPEIGYRILNTVNDMSEMANYILYHHERWDGKGYPKGLKEREIPFVSRIIAIADAYDAMTSERSYRSAIPEEVVLEELQKNAGIQFDPKLVSVFIENVLGKKMLIG